MKQYYDLKVQHPDVLILFRVGDFYETFDEDAVKCSKILNITLTKRNNGAANNVNLSGFPYYALNNYLPKLINSGLKIAICEQLENIKSKNCDVIKRGITQFITPGLILNNDILNSKYNNFISSIYFNKSNIGVAFLDVSTGEFYTSEGNVNSMLNLVNKFNPSEIVYSKKQAVLLQKYRLFNNNCRSMDNSLFNYKVAYNTLVKHFNTNSLKGFGLNYTNISAIVSSAVILHFLSKNYFYNIDHILKICIIKDEKYLWMDDFTVKNLEIFKPNNIEGVALIKILDKTATCMGSRLLKFWLNFPINDINEIIKRQTIVKFFFTNENTFLFLRKGLKNIIDIERLLSKISFLNINYNEIVLLYQSLQEILKICKNILKINDKNIKIIFKYFPKNKIKAICIKIKKTINLHYCNSSNSGNFNSNNISIINPSFSKKIKKIIQKYNSNLYYLNKIIINKEKKNSHCNKLKLLHNNILGYYIDINNSTKLTIPKHWILKQNLLNSKRYITNEIKNYETLILMLRDKIHCYEKKTLNNINIFLKNNIKYINKTSKIISYIDVLSTFYIIAKQNNYICPIINNSCNIYIKSGRHPVIEQQLLKNNNSYISNDLIMDKKNYQIMILTGPNMSGKSAFLRQIALIIILSHIGSYVPAKYVKLGLVDKIFSRIGSSDNISIGESTFMTEMNETANILNNLSKRSFIILDELGKGTSSSDGLSLAISIIEYLHNHVFKPKTLFSTHYLEIHNFISNFKRIKNFKIYTKKIKETLFFKRKLKKGISESSFGIYIAKMAGIPIKIVNRSLFLLKNKIENKKH